MNTFVDTRILQALLLIVLFTGLLSCKSGAPKPPESTPAAKAPATPTVADGLKVTMDCTLTLQDKATGPCSANKGPIVYIHGQHRLLPSLEMALTGLKVGDKKSVPLTPDQAFGPYDEKKKITVKRMQLPQDAKIGSGVRTKEGAEGRVVALSDDSAVLDFNHPFAGKNVTYAVTILGVEKP